MTTQSKPRNALVYGIGKPPFTSVASLPASITLLRQRHDAVLTALDGGPPARRLTDNLLSLRLAEASLDKAEWIRRRPQHPLQIAVIGPTQSGKSSVVNRLLGAGQAQVSPLAGYTVHPQGFPLNLADSDVAWLEDYFHDYRRCLPTALPPDDYAYFGLAAALHPPAHPLPPAVIWDTPDFDSVDASDYRNAVLRTAALADVLLLVVSKDKYADQAVWDMLRLLEPLGQPTLVCLNKLDAGSSDTLLASLREKWQAARADQPAGVVSLPWVEDLHGLLPATAATTLLAPLAAASAGIQRTHFAARTQAFINLHWADWLGPIRQELAAQAQWAGLVEAAFDEALTIYRRDFLDHPHHYETFQRALAELLTLLEIPGLASGMVAARTVLTWPVRQLLRLGKSLRKANLGQETAVLNRTLEHLFIHLGQALLEKGADPQPAGFWRELGAELRRERTRGEAQRTAALARHVEAFQPEIERTARQLHAQLRKHPAVLNTLRATRASADAAALGMALHTGGIGLQDFIIAPAILSVTSLLTESALGHFMQRAEAELKQRQFEETARLFDDALKPALLDLPQRLQGEGRFNLSAECVAAAEALLAAARLTG